MEIEQALSQALAPEHQAQAAQFGKFIRLLLQWNKAYNLTAIRAWEDMIPLHILDCLAIIPYLQGPNILDVGSGAGFPGIPLALACPHLKLTLVESNRKRVQFLQTVKHELQLSNLSIWQGRVEDYQPDFGFDTITSRAFSHLVDFTKLTEHLLKQSGQWCAMKGQISKEELESIKRPYQVYPYAIPGHHVARCCVVINHKD